ncbi:MBOAT family protein [Cryomorpha ignava]|uniref:MBOAT family protein n=1 Tax=Cryomorpha ignava TaxID=101383 RepID=A0A7K3WUY3_9FLAO|nr:MBOAT family protein [Cryomorpha ignava]NEN25314.1 MBOAT family protein [Cryomorpha ignava]
MLFNSLDFAIFLPIVFLLFWFVTKTRKQQNGLIVLASYVFYGWWDWRFLSLILFSTLVDYTIGLQMGKTERVSKRKVLLWTSLLVNLGLLGFFKYYNFFVDNFITAFSFFGHDFQAGTLNVILPVGISFYTFQTLSYTIDVYRRQLEPTRDFMAFTAFVSFFPQLVAGPIERATHLLPQFFTKKKFSYPEAVDGMRQILWGLFKKVVIADNCGAYADIIFNNSDQYSGLTLVLGGVFFAFQIYGDFSGYSDIAIGTGRLFGFRLMQNFAFPYFSRDIAEFWRRWHISLSTWFRDYLYIPLGGSRGSMAKVVRNVFIIFLVSGFWHGANWTFVIWGGLNAIYFLPLLLFGKNRRNLDVIGQHGFPSFREIAGMVGTFGLTVIAWIFFRADSVGHAFGYIAGIFTKEFFVLPSIQMSTYTIFPKTEILLVVIFIVMEWLGRENAYTLEKMGHSWKRVYRYALYYVIIFAIFFFGGQKQEFIYFQF